MTTKTIAAGLFGAFVGGWLGRAAFSWILDVDWWLVGTAACAVVGAAVCVAGEREESGRRGRE